MTCSHPKSITVNQTIFSDKIADHTIPDCVSFKTLNGDIYISPLFRSNLSLQQRVKIWGAIEGGEIKVWNRPTKRIAHSLFKRGRLSSIQTHTRSWEIKLGPSPRQKWRWSIKNNEDKIEHCTFYINVKNCPTLEGGTEYDV